MSEPRVKPLEFVSEHSVSSLGPYRFFRAKTVLGDVTYGTDAERVSWYCGPEQKSPISCRSEDAAQQLARRSYETAVLNHPVLSALAPLSVETAARVLLDATDEDGEIDDTIQTAMQTEADTDGTDEWVFVFRAALRALAGEG